ncbi:hypothetical protein GCM10009639_47040 [Kitasatospora putterlickiae]|uniref:Uncharacterized protein n=1 Tax=Kitasatospora putterlickiae TaxID=221725 RepID=A0ABN1YB33_9ACTN
MTAQPVQPHLLPEGPRTIREFRGVLTGGDLERFNAEIEDVPLHEIREYLKSWRQLLHLRTVPEIEHALRTAFDRPGTPVGDLFPEWEELSV